MRCRHGTILYGHCLQCERERLALVPEDDAFISKDNAVQLAIHHIENYINEGNAKTQEHAIAMLHVMHSVSGDILKNLQKGTAPPVAVNVEQAGKVH